MCYIGYSSFQESFAANTSRHTWWKSAECPSFHQRTTYHCCQNEDWWCQSKGTYIFLIECWFLRLFFGKMERIWESKDSGRLWIMSILSWFWGFEFEAKAVVFVVGLANLDLRLDLAMIKMISKQMVHFSGFEESITTLVFDEESRFFFFF